jgi:oxaloacetate decarboxylase (Na+ extruding) subunit alpha
MNIKEVKDLIHEILQSDISEFELEHTGTKVRLRRGCAAESVPPPSVAAVSNPRLSVAPTPPAIAEAPQPPPTAEESAETGLHLITSPIVGTFYRSPSPGAEPFVRVGQMVEEGTTLCIIEAMKLMNEIPSDAAGEVVRIFMENGQPVEYGQKLFGIRPRK